jgi:hypothetical protein
LNKIFFYKLGSVYKLSVNKKTIRRKKEMKKPLSQCIKCEGKTASGKECHRKVCDGEKYCWQHQHSMVPQKLKEKESKQPSHTEPRNIFSPLISVRNKIAAFSTSIINSLTPMKSKPRSLEKKDQTNNNKSRGLKSILSNKSAKQKTKKRLSWKHAIEQVKIIPSRHDQQQ